MGHGINTKYPLFLNFPTCCNITIFVLSPLQLSKLEPPTPTAAPEVWTAVMVSFPQELIDRICFYLPLEGLKNTLTVSRCFQTSTERASGAFRKFTLTEANEEAFLKIYGGYRYRYLREVTFITGFPALEMPDEEDDENVEESDEEDEEGAEIKDDEDENEEDVYPDDVPENEVVEDEVAEDGFTADEVDENSEFCRDTIEDLRTLDESFSKQIVFLFTALKTLEDRVASEHGPGRIRLNIHTPERQVGDGFCIHRKFLSWRLHLLSPETLPELHSIRTLSMKQGEAGQCHCEEPDGTASRLDLRILLDLCVKLRNLESLESNLWSDEWTLPVSNEDIQEYSYDFPGPRRDSRHDFAKALQTADIPASLKHLQLYSIFRWQLDGGSVDQRKSLPNLVKPALCDPFSSSLRILSYQLRHLNLQAVVDEALFWADDGNTPYWPNLEVLAITFYMATPKGKWAFQGPKGEGRGTAIIEITPESYPPLAPNAKDKALDKDNWIGVGRWENHDCAQYRIIPIDEVIVPILTGFAKALANMPSLLRASLSTPLIFQAGEEINEDYDNDYVPADFPRSWGLTYVAPGSDAPWKLRKNLEVTSEAHRLWWDVAKWRPDEELHNLFQEIGRPHVGNLIEYWE